MSSTAKEAAKTRRLLELYLYLTNVQAPVGRDRIRANVEGYRDLTDEAFDRQFERDKRDFRSLGVGIDTSSDDGSEVLARYRIRPQAQRLPELGLTAEEVAALQVAREVWHQVDLFAQASGAVRKLVREEVALADSPLAGLSPRGGGREPAFDDLRRALRTRTAVTFRYRTAEGTQVRARHVQPWQLVLRHGAAYLRGYDLDRGAERVFRLSRMSGDVRRTGGAGAYTVPTGLGPLFAEDAPQADEVCVTLAVAPGRAQALRLQGRQVDEPPPPAVAGWDVLRVVTRRPQALVDTALTYGADVLVLSPPDLREHVVDRLRAVAAGRR